jgi:hypothetical protein
MVPLAAGLAALHCQAPVKTGGDGGVGHYPDGSTGTPSDGGPDAGPGPCHTSSDCSPLDYCAVSTGECLPAKPCMPTQPDPTGSASCEYPGTDYCGLDNCYCDTNRGVCLPRIAPCQPCTSDTQCGSDPGLYPDYTAKCVALAAAGGANQKVCVPVFRGTCPPGYVIDTTGMYCVPAGGSCGAAGACTSDADCDPMSQNPECDSARGICIAACTFDYTDGTSSCPPGQICHVDPRLLTPTTNPNFGGGVCGGPCNQSGGYTCPTGTMCVTDGASFLTNPPSRCRPPPPECIRDQDCPPSSANHSLGYCDFTSLMCQTGCETNSNCESGYNCTSGACTQETCVQAGGALLACGFQQFCCGETGGPPCPSGTAQGTCYDAPDPPWCGTCTAGQSVATPTGSTRPQPSQCQMGKIWDSCDPSIPAQCPNGWGCHDGLMFCNMDTDCGSGGKCEMLDTQYGQTMGCTCSNGNTCPSPLSTCQTGGDGGTPVCTAKWCDMRFCYQSMSGQ